MTKFKINFNKYYQIICIFLLLSLILSLILLPKISINAFSEGIQIWATKVLPALLPFFILTKLLSYTSFIDKFGRKINPLTQKLYGVNGNSGYVYLMSIISGYPVGAKLTSDLYSNKTITRGQAITITSFTSTSGPLFIIGTVAIGLFNSSRLGIILLLSHLIGSILNGLIYKCKDNSNVVYSLDKNVNNILQDSMSSSIISISIVGGFIAIFYMTLKILLHLNFFNPIITLLELFGIDRDISTAIICGIFEVTTGCIYLSKSVCHFNLIAGILSFLIGFGGLSIHAQAFCYLKSFNMSYGQFLLQKITQASLSCVICIVLCFII